MSDLTFYEKCNTVLNEKIQIVYVSASVLKYYEILHKFKQLKIGTKLKLNNYKSLKRNDKGKKLLMSVYIVISQFM